jgi:hypothetical protein
MEKERLDKEAPYGMLYMIDNKPVSYDEFKKNSR